MQAYFPLASEQRPSLASLTAAWQEHLPAIEAVAQRFGKPVIFTEIGYRSTADAAIEPWAWPQDARGAVPDPDTQARCYEAFFATAWQEPWLAGAFIWKWYPKLGGRGPGGPGLAAGFTPQGKPAEKVLTRYYSD